MRFVDTNVLLYAISRDPAERGKAERANELLAARDLALSVQVLQEFYVNVTRKVAKPITPESAADRLRSLSRWRVHSPLADDVIAATSWSTRYQLSFWDAMIVRSAAELRCDTLWTEDLSDGRLIEGVRLANPFSTG